MTVDQDVHGGTYLQGGDFEIFVDLKATLSGNGSKGGAGVEVLGFGLGTWLLL